MATVGKPITCKAAVMWEKGADLVIEDVEVAPPKAGEVRLKVFASGVCHTDYSEPRNYPAGFPVILGHEGAGLVESVGEGVTSVAPGDAVIPLYIPECRDCIYCLSQRTNLCGKIIATQGDGLMPDGTSRFTCKGQRVLHFMGTSTFSEYTVCAEISLAKVSSKAPLDKVGLLGCGISTGYGAVMNTMKVTCGSTAAVFGVGGVGLAVIMGLKEVGCSKIIAVDLNPEKEALARSFGATHFVNPKALPEGKTGAEAVCALVGDYRGVGVDYSFECVGNVGTMRQALECTHKGWGQSCIIGVGPPGHEISTRPFQLVIGKTWKGSAFGGTRGRTQLPGYVEKYLDGKFKVDEFITSAVKLNEINEAFRLLEAGQAIRTMVVMPHDGDEEVAAHRAKCA